MRLKKGSDRKETGMVFTKDNGEWLHPDSIPRWLNNFSRDNGLPHIHPPPRIPAHRGLNHDCQRH